MNATATRTFSMSSPTTSTRDVKMHVHAPSYNGNRTTHAAMPCVVIEDTEGKETQQLSENSLNEESVCRRGLIWALLDVVLHLVGEAWRGDVICSRFGCSMRRNLNRREQARFGGATGRRSEIVARSCTEVVRGVPLFVRSRAMLLLR